MTDIRTVPEVELAYQILKKTGQAMYYKDLISEALLLKGINNHPLTIAAVHTQINMDSRFVHMGKGMWGILDWSPQQLSSNIEFNENISSADKSIRRERLFEEIQQEYVAATNEHIEQE